MDELFLNNGAEQPADMTSGDGEQTAPATGELSQPTEPTEAASAENEAYDPMSEYEPIDAPAHNNADGIAEQNVTQELTEPAYDAAQAPEAFTAGTAGQNSAFTQPYQPQQAAPYPYPNAPQPQPAHPYAQPAFAQPPYVQPAYPQQGTVNRPYPPYAQPARPNYAQPAPQPTQPVGQPAPRAYAPSQGTVPNAYVRAPYPYAAPAQQPAYRPAPAYPQAPQQAQPADMNGNPYAQPVQQAQPVQPAAQYAYPYYAPAQPMPEPKPKTSTGTKVFLIILSALLVAMLVGFIIYISHIADRDSKSNSFDNGFTPNTYDDYFDREFGGGNDNGSMFGSNSSEEFDEEITLVEDNGDTQKRDDDDPDSVGSPDKDAKSVELKQLPKYKDDPKYTTQSAYDAVSDSVVTINLYNGEITENVNDIVSSGTGTVISADGYIVTNAHVISNSRAYAVKVVMNSGESYRAKVIGYDTWTDLAVIKIDAKDLTPVEFGDSELIEIGQDVIAIGSPGGEKFRNSLTKGIVSAVDRELSINKYVRYIQSDAAISPGNSGGPLCNIYGQVIGINTAKTTATNYEAMTFSIPSSTVKEIVNDLLRYGYVKGRPRIGFTGTAVSSEEQTYYGKPAGVLISEIDESGSLAGTKIKAGDIITAIDGEEIKSFQDIYAVLNEHKAGDKLTLTIYREE